MSQMQGVYPDPLASVSLLIPHSPDISTFRVSLQNDLSELVTVKDFTSQSALHGFSEVGGLWTFLGGIFAAIFGSSLVRILFGIYPANLRFKFPMLFLTHEFSRHEIDIVFWTCPLHTTQENSGSLPPEISPNRRPDSL